MADPTPASRKKTCSSSRNLYTIDGKDKTIWNYVILWRHARTCSHQLAVIDSPSSTFLAAEVSNSQDN